MREPARFGSGGARRLPLLALPLAAAALGMLLAPPSLQAQEPECMVAEQMPLEGRASPLDSASVNLGGETVKVCYGAPSARGRTMIGGENVPFGELWRTGANEPTMIHVTAPVEVGGIQLDPGSYSFYTIPGAEEWEFFVTRSTEHWGLAIDEEVRAQEVGATVLPRERPESHVETMQISFERESDREATMVIEWEEFRLRVPVERAE